MKTRQKRENQKNGFWRAAISTTQLKFPRGCCLCPSEGYKAVVGFAFHSSALLHTLFLFFCANPFVAYFVSPQADADNFERRLALASCLVGAARWLLCHRRRQDRSRPPHRLRHLAPLLNHGGGFDSSFPGAPSADSRGPNHFAFVGRVVSERLP